MFDGVNPCGDAAEQALADRKRHRDVVISDQHVAALRLFPGSPCTDAWNGCEEIAGILILGRIEEIDRRGRLNHFPLAHHNDPVGHLRNDAHVVGDENDGRPEFPLQVSQELKYLALYRHVERRRWFVRDENGGAQGNGHGDHHALTHAARELVGILLQPLLRLGKPDSLHRFERAGPCLRERKRFMGADCFDQLAPDAHNRVECGHRFLEDHGDACATHRLHRLFRKRRQLRFAEADGAPRYPHGRGRQEPHAGERGDGLAGAAFPRDRQCFSAMQIEAQSVDKRNEPLIGAGRDLQVANRQDDIRRLVDHG